MPDPHEEHVHRQLVVIGQRIQTARDAAGLSRTQLARLLGSMPGTLKRIEQVKTADKYLSPTPRTERTRIMRTTRASRLTERGTFLGTVYRYGTKPGWKGRELRRYY